MTKSTQAQSVDLTDSQIEAAKAKLMALAETQYKKISKSVSIMEQFWLEITALRRTGHPWNSISTKLKEVTGVPISATTLRNYWASKTGVGGGKKTRQESVNSEPNVFEQSPETQTPREYSSPV